MCVCVYYYFTWVLCTVSVLSTVGSNEVRPPCNEYIYRMLSKWYTCTKYFYDLV